MMSLYVTIMMSNGDRLFNQGWLGGGRAPRSRNRTCNARGSNTSLAMPSSLALQPVQTRVPGSQRRRHSLRTTLLTHTRRPHTPRHTSNRAAGPCFPPPVLAFDRTCCCAPAATSIRSVRHTRWG